ncbi:multidrug resistance-associated 1 isoform X8 [Chlorella sorokiniana]|uniref:Multidrug resistance-associated 1 isoform X8 n=1 Tax=Chlorella sorokiniana TaxID=3076 RepID=A0A2P6U3Z6_CHLSO|nr:multidrug resistance-associated 1 isoform X8 [Chlorella sorokiniana]|eukprot:PRW61038.1 multidrug resistance-associated 1 isoform X8 [Chlorella sorokiniana]
MVQGGGRGSGARLRPRQQVAQDADQAAAKGAPAEPRGRWCPEENAGFLSRLLFIFVGGLIKLGYRKALDADDLWDVAERDKAADVSKAFQRHLEAAEGVVWRAMWRAHGRVFMMAGVLKLVHDCVMMLSPFILEQLLKELQGEGSRLVAFGLAVALAAGSLTETLLINTYFHILFRMCAHLKVELVDALYRKSLRVSSAAKGDLGAGKIVNLQSNDAAKLWMLPTYLHMVWSGPFQILVVMGLLVRVIHWAPALAGLGATLALIPIAGTVGRALAGVRRRLVGFTDARVKLCTEVITGIKAIKMYSWEEPYVERISALREDELVQIRKAALLGSVNDLVFSGGSMVIAMAALLTFAGMGYSLTASIAFPALSLFNLLRFPGKAAGRGITNLINGKVASDRVQRFMDSEEMAQQNVLPPAAPGQAAVDVAGGSFAWQPDAEPLLHDINLSVPRGSLVIVVGSVGSGKSSLLAALLREMPALAGSVAVRGRVAYTAQDPWIQNATLRDNVLLGAQLDKQRYGTVLEACALQPDLDMLPAGDETEIGEKGVNLSGGQKHRVALARACYAAADVYLLDDPLSAVDAHVGRHLFDRCICGLLGKTTRILVTHQLQHLPSADHVVVLRDGRLAEQGTYEELVRAGIDFHQFELLSESEEEGTEDEEQQGSDSGAGKARSFQGQKSFQGQTSLERVEEAVEEEEAAAEAAACEGGAGAAIEAGAEAGLPLGTQLFGDGAVQAQAQQPAQPVQPAEHAAPADATALVVVASPMGSPGSTPRAPASPRAKGSGKFKPAPGPVMAPTRKGMLDPLPSSKIIKVEQRSEGQVSRRVYLSYFKSWSPYFLLPTAVLALAMVERGLQAAANYSLSSWTDDTESAESSGGDPRVSFYMTLYGTLAATSLVFQVAKAVTLVVGAVRAACLLQERLLACVVRLPMSFFDSQPTGRLLNRFTKDVESVDTTLLASVLSFLSCMSSVLWSLVVVVVVSPVMLAMLVPLSVCYYYLQTRYVRSSREIKRLDSLAMSPIFTHFSETLQGLVTLRAFRQQAPFQQRSTQLLDASNRAWWPAQCINRWLSVRLEMLGITVVFLTALLVGVALPRDAGLAGLAITSALNLTGLMNWMVRQTTELEVNMNSVERMIEYYDEQPEALPVVEGRRPLPGWPQQGAIEVQDLVVRYRADLDPVLKGISFGVRGREKVGVAGRTGCGKSTLFLALFRIVEPCGGHIVIDGLDICSIGLRDLRSRLALVPQDPVIFSGTVRSNLDPFGHAGSDEAVWEALAQAGLEGTVRAMPGGLEAKIAEGGGNLSVGQRQLLCMARALLRGSRILVLDEATSSVDTATDALIQTTISSAFADCTVLTIAHRLHTIMNSDRILVLHDGTVKEYDSPNALLAQPNSAFRGMVEETATHRTTSKSGQLQKTVSAKVASSYLGRP